jgi:hypothetical protein
MRQRASHKAAYLAKEKARKAKLAKSPSGLDEDEESGNKQSQGDILKKDVTTDHNGKLI